MKYRKFHQSYEVKQYNQENGYFFFSPNTMRFFNSRMSQNVYHHPSNPALFNVFVTSEQFEDSRGKRAARQYKVRRLTESGDVATIGKAHASRYLAHKAAKRYAATGEIAL